MNTELTANLFAKFITAAEENGLALAFQQTLQSLQQCINNGNNAQFHNAFSSNMETLKNKLVSGMPRLSPKESELSKICEIDDLFGSYVADTIDELSAANKLTLPAFLDKLKKRSVEFQSTIDSMKSFIAACERFNLSEKEKCGNYIGITIPRESVGNSLERLVDKLEEFNTILRSFEEICTGTRNPATFKIEEISSSDPFFNVSIEDLKIAACIGRVISWTLSQVKSALKIRKLWQELRKEDVPTDALKPIEDHFSERVMNGADHFIEHELMKYAIEDLDAGRIRELKIAAKNSIRSIAALYENGFTFEVKFLQAPSTKTNEQQSAHHATLTEAMKNTTGAALPGQSIMKIQQPTDSNSETTNP